MKRDKDIERLRRRANFMKRHMEVGKLEQSLSSMFLTAFLMVLALVCALGVNVPYAAALPSGVVAAYGFNEGSGSTAWDVSGSSNTGTISGATWTTSGRFGNALTFNGTSSRVDINDSTSLHLTSGMTLEAWVYPTSSTGWRTAVMKERTAGQAYALYSNNNASRPAVYINIAGTDRVVTGTASVALNAWTHLAATYDGTTLRLYVNGTQVGSLAVSGTITVSSNSLRIGGSTTLTGRYFVGTIDEVRIYNRALTQAEIQTDLNTATPPDTTPPTAPANLAASTPSTGQINLSWTASTDNVGVTGYQVESCQGTGCSNFALVTTVTGTTYNNTGLLQLTTYSYRVRATDAAGNLSPYSNIATATTLDATAPTAPANLAASAVSETQINLSWTASTDNVGVTGYRIERCQGASCTSFSQVATTTGTTYNNTALTAGTSYSYRVRATDAVGNLSSYSNIATTTTLDTTPPTTPTNLTASTPSIGQINLSWTASTDNARVTGYQVERCQGAGCSNFALVTTVTGTTYNNTGLLQLTTYSYRVRATDAAGNLSPYSNIATATTLDATAPTAPANLTASAVSETQINLGWTASTDNVGVTGYRIERCQGTTCTLFSQIATTTGTTYNNTALTAGTGYRYRVRATDAVGNLSSYSNIATATTLDITPPTTPTNLKASTPTIGQINLSWTASTDNARVTGYQVERCQGAGCSNFALVTTVTGTTYNNTGLPQLTTYSYRVRATDAAGNLSPYSNIATAITLDATPPTAPANLTALTVGSNQINLSWTASTDNVGVTGYQVQRCQGASCSNFALVTTISGTSYSDTGLQGSTSYSYRVRATDAVGNLSSYSNTASSTTMKPVSVVLVNSRSSYYSDFQQFIQPYLDNFGIPYNVLDISATSVPSTIGDAAVIIVGHRELDVNSTYLSSTEQGYITSAVNTGTGLVNFDNALDDGGTPLYNYVQTIFNFGYGEDTSASDVTLPNPSGHFITQLHGTAETISTYDMTMAGITLPAGVISLATSVGAYGGGNETILAATTYGSGHAVQWGSYDWMSNDVKGPLFGLDDLVWRSIVWAARKPFVMQGMPPFVTLRMDDVSNPSWWLPIANEFGFIPWAGIFTDSVDSSGATILSNLAHSGKATVGLHAFGETDFFYFDNDNGINFSDAVMAAHYTTATSWFNSYNIPISKYLVPHTYSIGTNAFGGLQNWGVEYIGTMMDPGQLESGSPWMMKGPYRLYETGLAGDMYHNPYYADYMTIPGHSEMNKKFFNCVTEIRDVTGYEWMGNGRNGTNVAIQDGTEWLKRALDSMVLATLFSHEYTFIDSMSQAGWRSVLQGITNNISVYNPVYVSMDYACQYVRAKYNSKISANTYNAATQQITTYLVGYNDMATKFYMFYDSGGHILQTLVDVPQLNGSNQVVSTPPPPDTTPPTVTSVFPSNGSSNVTILPVVTATFSETMDMTTTNTSSFELRDSSGNLVPSSVVYTAATKTIELTPSGILANSATYTATVKGGIGGVKDASGNPMTSDFKWSFTTEAHTVLSMWDDTVTPQNEINDGQSIEVGVKFRSDISGYISGVRFYKGPQNTGTHIGHLWSVGGIQLATATFTNETASGWQEVLFPAPVLIAANTTYVASYYSPSGYFTVDDNYFVSGGADKGWLHFLADGVDGPNGVFKYGGGFPISAGSASNYWVDVVFQLTGPADTTPPTVYSVTPANNSSRRSISTSVTATFSEPIDPASITATTFELLDPSNVSVSAVVTYNPATWTATLDPVGNLAYSTQYKAVLKGGTSGVKDEAGNAMSSDYTWSFTTAPYIPPPNQGPGGPILVITSSSNPFTEYYAEILRTEGFNAFTVTNISSITSQYLSGFDVAVLGEMPLTSAQVTILSNWVNAGGNLISMRPDKQLASLLGLTDASSTLSNAYLLVNTSSGPGSGIVNETIQFHGMADLYSLNGASVVATLYSNAVAATSNPAVTLRNVGSSGGHAAAFTYDLAKSVVYTRQGNPAWAGQERDGIIPIRTDDLFFGAASFDPEPDWIDLNKVAIPQADEQQRLLANLIIQMNLNKKPLPRFWYFPWNLEAVVVMTSDNHGGDGLAPRLDDYIAASPSGCSVDNWECIRSTVYFERTPISEFQADSYNALGFEIGLHIDTDCADWTPDSLETIYSNELGEFYANYPSLPSPITERVHCIAWSDYDTQPQVEFNHGIRLDTTYYYWPGSWINNRPGLFTGSGMPMRFAKADGTLIDVYQAATQMTDESGQSYPFTINTLLDKAIGPEGYYGAFTANMHSDFVQSDGTVGSDAIIGAALARHVPIVSALQMLEWLDSRNLSSFGAITRTGNTLTFAISVGQGANGLTAMVPIPFGSMVSSINQNGSPVQYSTMVIKGIQYASFSAGSGSYQVMFLSDTTPPQVSSVSPPNGALNVRPTSDISAMFSKSIDPASVTTSTFVLLDSSNAVVPANVTYDATSKTATLDPTNSLIPFATYVARVKGGSNGIKDLAGNALGSDVTWSFSTGDFTIWYDSSVPQLYDAVSDGQPIDVGVKFRADLNGYVTGIRFYKGTANTGTHVGNLWDSSGNLLASATFTNETASGWQEVTFATPVAITANTTYVASYYSSSGYFAMDVGYFSPLGVDNGPLHALANGVDGPNGVFTYGSGFPTSSGNSNNYWVDVVFGSLQPDLTPPAVVSVFPAIGSTVCSSGAKVTASFSKAMNPATINTSTFVLVDSSNAVVPAQVTYDATSKTATLVPINYLISSASYTATIVGGSNGVKDLVGNPMGSAVTWSFASSDHCTIWNIIPVPQYDAVTDGQPIDVGVKFRADLNGYVTGIRFYKGTANTGTHVGNLWDSSGNLLESATFTNETASGWQEVTFATPVAITANTTYVASYYSSSGYYSMDVGYFSPLGVDNSPLHALANGVDGPNGVYTYGSGFPTSYGNSNNYWVDVVYHGQ